MAILDGPFAYPLKTHSDWLLVFLELWVFQQNWTLKQKIGLCDFFPFDDFVNKVTLNMCHAKFQLNISRKQEGHGDPKSLTWVACEAKIFEFGIK